MASFDLVEIVRFLRKYNMKQTELCVDREFKFADVNDYFVVYSYLSKFILNSAYELELVQCLFPFFVHLYLDLIEKNYIEESHRFYEQFVDSNLYLLHKEFFYQLKLISYSSKHLYRCALTEAFRSGRFFLRLSMTSCNELENFMQIESQVYLTLSQLNLLRSIFQQYIKIDINQQVFAPSHIVRFRTSEQPMTPLFVHINIAHTIQFTRLYTGLSLNYHHLSSHKLPSICLYTLKTSKQMINCVTLSNDCRLLAIGFQSSEILIYSLNLKTTNVLIGHSNSIFALAFEPTKQLYLLSGSQDCTIRLWYLSTWSCLLVYKMHYQPILDVNFASNGQFFASCSMDGLVAVWTIDKINPLRIYPEYGHSGPINLVEFHPNSNYLATAHYDHTIHLWNIHHENSLVRIFNGHRHSISSLRFSPNGHFLASGCWNGELILWDIQNNLQIAHLSLHKQAISSIEFSSLNGTLLFVASIDSTLSLWNCLMISKMYDEKLSDPIPTNPILLNVFKTNQTSLYHIRFSKETILHAIALNNNY